MKFNLIIADCPWNFNDGLSMTKTKRGASSNYETLSISDLKNLKIKEISEDDAVLALWVPSSLLEEGLEVMKAWGFRQTQTHIWVKTKKNPFKNLLKEFTKVIKDLPKKGFSNIIRTILLEFDINNILSFGMGRLFRQTHEIILIGVKGKIYKHLKNKSQRSVHFSPATKHSVKPENLHNMLEKMFPNSTKLELFARRQKPGWLCIGNQSFITEKEDIRLSIDKLTQDLSDIKDNLLSGKEDPQLKEIWSHIKYENVTT